MKKLALIFGLAALMCGQVNADVLINEFHYDNSGADVGEFVEIAVLQGTTLSDINISLYNGSNGTAYASTTADTLGAAFSTGVAINSMLYDLFVWEPSSIQNGEPDGIAVTSASGRSQFISYEGTLTAVEGIVEGVLSTDVGVSERGDTAIGSSISFIDGDWVITETNTRGQANVVPEPSSLLVLSLVGLVATRRRR